MNGRENSFDLIRHFAAFLVLFSHHYPLSGLQEPTISHWDTLGFVAVAIFFSISGFFMPQSYAGSEGFVGFMAKRCRRIFPGLVMCALFMVYVVGAIFTTDYLFHYFFSIGQLKTVVMFSMFSGRAIPGVFSDFVVKDAINGSLWTLPVEFFCYIIIGFVFSLRFSWKSVACLLWVACIGTATVKVLWSDFSFYGIPMSYLALFGIPFFVGALLSMTRQSWERVKWPLVVVALLILWLFRGRPEIQVLGTASIAVITVVLGTSFKDRIIKGRFDISYGVYIYAFPVQQIVINRVVGNFWLGMLLSSVVTIVFGYLSYKYVELPFLHKKRIAQCG